MQLLASFKIQDSHFCSQDHDKISRALVTISNLAAFTKNQDWLREAGILLILPSLLSHTDPRVQLAAVRAAANLALNTGNMKEMEQTVLGMVMLADNTDRNIKILTLQWTTLINILSVT